MRNLNLYPERGFTLLETLISLFILTTALLGFAALSTQALQATRGAIHHDLATLQAIDMAERMRSNPLAVHSSSYFDLSGTPAGSDCSATSCDPTMMAKFDLREWNQRNTSLLPSGVGVIDNRGDHIEITIQWQEGVASVEHTLQITPL